MLLTTTRCLRGSHGVRESRCKLQGTEVYYTCFCPFRRYHYLLIVRINHFKLSPCHSAAEITLSDLV
jgi:hypothetical protein